jgi:hypothetical protein
MKPVANAHVPILSQRPPAPDAQGRGQAGGTCMLYRAARPGVLLTRLIDRKSLPARVSVARQWRAAPRNSGATAPSHPASGTPSRP